MTLHHYSDNHFYNSVITTNSTNQKTKDILVPFKNLNRNVVEKKPKTQWPIYCYTKLLLGLFNNKTNIYYSRKNRTKEDEN